MALRRERNGDAARDLRVERERLDRVRAEIGERFAEVQRRERELERRLAAGLPPSEPAPAPAKVIEADSALERRLEEKERELIRREREVAERETALAAATPPADPDARLAEIAARLAELRVAETLFAATRRELEERSVAVEAAEQRLRQRELELDEQERPPVSLPGYVDEPSPGEVTDERGPGFSGGLLELQRRGLRRRDR